MKKMIIKSSLNLAKVPNKMHLDAQIRFPARVSENRKAYNRKRMKREMMKENY